MKAVKPSGLNHWGKLAALLAILVLAAGMIILAGCGDDATDNGTQTDNANGGDDTADIKNIDSAGGLNLAGDDEVLTGYTWSDCVVEMSTRYGDESTAEKVCEGLYTGHRDTDVAQLDTALAAVESELGIAPGADTGGSAGDTGGDTGGGTDGPGGTGGTGGGTGSGGWSTEIIVPPAP